MKAPAKVFVDFVAWRWAPALALGAASLLYVLVVVALVPEEIGVPISNARFAPKSLGEGRLKASTQATPSFPTAATEEYTPPPIQTAALPEPAADFGRRGFSPPLERPDPPPAPEPPPPPPPVAVPAPAPPPDEVAAAPVTPPPPAPPGRILRALTGGLRNILPGAQNAEQPAEGQPAEGTVPAPSGAPEAPEAPNTAPGQAPGNTENSEPEKDDESEKNED